MFIRFLNKRFLELDSLEMLKKLKNSSEKSTMLQKSILTFC